MSCTKLRWLLQKIRYMPEFIGIILYFIYTMSVPVFEQYFFKRYSEKYGYNWSLSAASSKGGCHNGNSTDPTLVKVQDAVSEFLADNSMCLIIPSILFGIFYGPLSDRVGRKPILLLNTSGFLIMCVVTVLVEVLKLDLWYVHVGSAFFGIGGYIGVSIMILQTYMSDIVEADNLPARLGSLNMVLFASLSISNFISGVVLKSFGFLLTFSILAALAVVAILLNVFQLAESFPKEKRATQGNWLGIPKDSWLLLMAPRSRKWRFYFLIPIDVFTALVDLPIVAPIILLRLLNTPFCWSPVDIGVFRGSSMLASGVGSAILLKLLPKVAHKGFTMFVAFLSAGAFYMCLGLASSKFLIYMGVVGGIFMAAQYPMSRGILSSTVNDAERGTLFGLLNTLSSIALIIGTFTYEWFYRIGNENERPGAVFTGIAFLPILPILIILLYIPTEIRDERRRNILAVEDVDSLSRDIDEDDVNYEGTEPLLS